ncbi:hypothetical protein DMH27_17500 [Raoultella planticola]|nr:hypothetical protein [Raoultella planticola]
MNESPFDMIRQKRLRDDLFYRLEIGMVVIPPSERKDEIIPLARHFMAKHQRIATRMFILSLHRLKSSYLITTGRVTSGCWKTSL